MRDDTKLAKIREAMEKGDWKVALKIAGTFARLGEHEAIIKRASESIDNPNFYRQLGYNLDMIKEEGITALKERFSKSWEETKKRKE